MMLFPKDPTPEQRAALFAMLPPAVQVEATARGDVLTRLTACDVEDDLIEAFDTALIENGGTHIGPFLKSGPRSGDDNHQHELDLLGAYGCGATYPAAIASWRKAAERMGVAP